MLITINGVEITKAPKGYQVAEVKFVREGKDEVRKILSFVSPAVFAQLSNFKQFPVDVNVLMEKNEKTGYWDWKQLEVGEQNKPMSDKPSVGRVIGSNYETPEERARKQVYIVRQSSLSTAVELAKAQSPKGTGASVDDVIMIAEQFEQYVMNLEAKLDV